MSRWLPALLFATWLPAPASAAFLYGITETDLIEIDPTDPGVVRTIGAHGLDGRLLYSLDQDPGTMRLVGLSLIDLGAGIYAFATVAYDLRTGAGSVLQELGTSNAVGFFDALVYVDALSAFVSSYGATTNTSELVTLDPDTGASSPIVATPAPDLDALAYDDVRDLVYGWDPNGANELTVLDPSDGSQTVLGALPAGSAAGTFSEEDGGLFLIERDTNSLLRIDTTDGGAPIQGVDLGLFSADPLRALAFSPVPEPAAHVLLAVGALVLGIRVRRREAGRGVSSPQR